MISVLFLLEPVFIPVIRAGDLPVPPINTQGVDGIVSLEEIVAPADYLDYMLTLRGRTKEEAEARAWGEWMMTLSSAYMQMDDGASDVFSFYTALSLFKDNRTAFKDMVDTMKFVSKQATLLFAFIGKTNVAARSGNLIEGFVKMSRLSQKAQNFIKNNKVLNFMEFMAPPPCWNNPKVAGEGFKSYWRWFRKKTVSPTGKGLGPGKYISDSKGIAQSIGIGLVIFGLAVDSYGILTSEDRMGERYFSYSLVKNYVGLLLGLGSLIAMFCVPIVGQVVMIATGIWLFAIGVGDLVGSYNRRWKEAYKNSYFYLYENDPEFKSFYDNRDSLDDEERAASLLIVLQKFGSFMAEEAVGSSEQDQEIAKKNKRVFEELEKQGVLASYYSQKGFNLPDFSNERLKALWQMKADYMSWKPSEAEAKSEKSAGFWGKVGKYINPMTYIGWVGDKIQSKDYENEMKEYNLKKVFFNPDYVLAKKYQNYVAANKLRGGIYDVVGLRIEQAPFNYIPLVDIEAGKWNKKLLEESFAADSFFIGVKEMLYFKEQIKAAKEKTEAFVEEMDETIKKVDSTDLPHTAKIRRFLDLLAESYKSDPGRKNDTLVKEGRKAFGWRWNDDNGDATPEKIIRIYRSDIEQALLYEPLSIAQKAAETVLLLSNMKQQMDTAKMMRSLGQEKREALAEFSQNITNEAFVRYIKEGDFLGVEWGLMDWLGQQYPAYDEMEKSVNLYFREVEDYTGAVDEANSLSRERFLWFDKEITHPKELLRKLNNELQAYSDTVEKFGEVAESIDLEVKLYEDQDFANKVFTEFKLGYDLEAIDLDQPVQQNN